VQRGGRLQRTPRVVLRVPFRHHPIELRASAGRTGKGGAARRRYVSHAGAFQLRRAPYRGQSDISESCS
jgi:hypothetical protein